jgi:hypothetical protein
MTRLFASIFTTVSLLAWAASAMEPQFGPFDVPTVFYIDKTDDHNRVDYGLRLDSHCLPVGREPLFPYWREFEHSPPVRTHPLGVFEYIAYGVTHQQLFRSEGAGGSQKIELQIELRRVHRVIRVAIRQDENGHCVAVPHVAMAGVAGLKEAQFLSAHVTLTGLLKVAYVDLNGKDESTGALIQERLHP